MNLYPTLYTDTMGTEHCFFESDGKQLYINIRGCMLEGRSFDDLSLQNTDAIVQPGITLHDGTLTNCRLQVTMPLLVSQHDATEAATLQIQMQLQQEKETMVIACSIDVKDKTYQLPHQPFLSFEYLLPALQKQLPQGLYIKSCLFCAYSNYSISGSEGFGTLICFKAIKEKIVAVNNKEYYSAIPSEYGLFVQETYCCPEFHKIMPGQWQYKDDVMAC